MCVGRKKCLYWDDDHKWTYDLEARRWVRKVEVMKTLNEMLDELRGYTSSEALAGLFHKEGITGKRANPNTCPVARYLSKSTGQTVQVFPFIVQTISAGIETPGVVTSFVDKFDRGDFPDLIEGE